MSVQSQPSPRRDESGGGREGREAGSDVVLVDAANVAHASEGEPRLSYLLAVRDKLLGEGMKPVIVADAALRHRIDDPAAYERLVESGEVHQAPAGTDADYFILSFARELDASIVSNDLFRDRLKQFPEARERVIRFMIVQDEVVLERRTKRR